MAAAENDEVVGVGDNLAMECFTPTAETPMLQEPVHCRRGKVQIWMTLNDDIPGSNQTA
ncbi:hypothetical protein MTX20_37730 [Bradyrhizobium sp. ISRA435]|nr:hypothetical protein MTX20_37730 [Bradyrhizobium sp. ISRA435]